MAIEYKDMKFEKIEELIAYKEWEAKRIKDIDVHKQAAQGITEEKATEKPKFFNIKRYWTKEQDEFVRVLIAQGKTLSEIAKKIGKSRGAVLMRLHRIKFPIVNIKPEPDRYKRYKRYKHWSKEETEQLRIGLEQNLPLHKLANNTNHNKESAYRKAYNDFFEESRYLRRGFVCVSENEAVPKKERSAQKKSGSRERMKWIHNRTKQLLPQFNNNFSKAYMEAIAQYRQSLGKVREESPLALKLGLTTFGLENLERMFDNKGKLDKVSYSAASVVLERSDKEQWSVIKWIEFCKSVISLSEEIRHEFGFPLSVVRESHDYYLVRA